MMVRSDTTNIIENMFPCNHSKYWSDYPWFDYAVMLECTSVNQNKLLTSQRNTAKRFQITFRITHRTTTNLMVFWQDQVTLHTAEWCADTHPKLETVLSL